mmetsp:Transcript_34093/g.25162  ORF Transcript_34093/g.25162 Transcript_34093/m.25162 type:complete len:473 (-) Transcript_34093:341-1759(-)
MNNYKGKDEIRKEFEAVSIPKHSDKSISKESFQNTYLRRVFVEIPVVLLSLGITVTCYGLIQWWRRDNKEDGGSVYIDYTASVINSIIMICLSYTYRFISNRLVNWENHKTQEEWENSLTTKIFAFSFINSYLTLFYYAFYEKDFNEVTFQLVSILLAKQIAVNALEVFLPWLKNKFFMKRLNEKLAKGEIEMSADPKERDEQLFIEKQIINEKGSNVLIDRYNEIVLQFGYIVIFAPAFTLAPLASIISNFVEMKQNINMLAYYSKRFEAKAAKGIGSWRGILEILSVISISTNMAIIYYTSEAVNERFSDLTSLERFSIVVGIEHLILGLKMFLSYLIQDVPGWVFRQRGKEDDRLEDIMQRIEERAEEFRAKGGMLFKDTIKQLKETQKKEMEVLSEQIHKKAKEEAGEDLLHDEDDHDGKVFKKNKKKHKITVSALQNFKNNGEFKKKKMKDAMFEMVLTQSQKVNFE